jgi:ABC-2 type transport system permease protein
MRGAREAEKADANDGGFEPVRVKVVDVLGQQKQSSKPLLAFYAAGTAVMFLLFSCSGAGGALLEEQESGTLERLLSSRLSMTGLLGGKWLFLTLMGVVQVTIMFIYGWAVFGIELFTPRHLAGFVVMTLATAGAAAAFGLVLASLCRSRAQLGGLATIVILMMSAVGGSMFPRFLMPEAMQTAGLATFNAWALDGYQKVFWYEKQPWELWPQVLVLVALGAAFFAAARWFARRWEAV